MGSVSSLSLGYSLLFTFSPKNLVTKASSRLRHLRLLQTGSIPSVIEKPLLKQELLFRTSSLFGGSHKTDARYIKAAKVELVKFQLTNRKAGISISVTRHFWETFTTQKLKFGPGYNIDFQFQKYV